MGNGKHYNIPCSTRFSFLPVRKTIFAINTFPNLFFISSSTGTIFAINIFPYPVFMSSSMENHIHSLYLPVPVYHFFQYWKPYSLSISFRTCFSFLPIRETIFALNIFQFFISSRTGSRTRISIFPVWETVDIIMHLPVPVFHFFPYGKPYSLSISSRTSLSFLPGRKSYSLSIYSHTRFSFLSVGETIFTLNIFSWLAHPGSTSHHTLGHDLHTQVTLAIIH